MLITSGSQRVMLIWLKFPQRKFNIDCFGLKVITRHLFAYKLKKDKMDASLLHLWLSNILKQLPLGQVCAHSSCFFFNIWYIFHFSDSSCQKSKKSWFVSWERIYFYKPTQIMSLKTCFSSFVIRTRVKRVFFSGYCLMFNDDLFRPPERRYTCYSTWNQI